MRTAVANMESCAKSARPDGCSRGDAVLSTLDTRRHVVLSRRPSVLEGNDRTRIQHPTSNIQHPAASTDDPMASMQISVGEGATWQPLAGQPLCSNVR